MKAASSLITLKTSLILVICIFLFAAKNSDPLYQCIPCGQECDKKTWEEPGKCTDCKMDLVPSSSITFKTVEPVVVCDYIATQPDVILLDVRTKEEFEGHADPDFGSLKNAINIPVQELEKRLAELHTYKNREIIVYCSHSHRSPQAAYLLSQNGFTKISNMSGGMSVLENAPCKK